MKIHRFITTFEHTDTELRITNHEVIHQIHRVLRLKPGESVVITNTKHVATITLSTVTEHEIIGTITNIREARNITKRTITLAVAIPKKHDLLELIVQKCVELGVSKIVPITTERTVKNTIRHDRLAKIALEAVELSGQDIPPIITNVTSLPDVLAQYPNPVLCDPNATTPLTELVQDDMTIIIGPEGGLSDMELRIKTDAPLASLGTTTLRIETAAIVATYVGTQI